MRPGTSARRVRGPGSGVLRLFTPAGIAVAVLGAVLVALGAWWRYPGLLAIGIGLLVIVALDVAAVLSSHSMRATRIVEPRVVQRHGDCTAQLTLSGALTRLPVAVTAVDECDGTPIEVPLARDGGPSVDYRIPTGRRGTYQVGPVKLRRRGIAGFAERVDTVGEIDQVRVLPRPIAVHGLLAGQRKAATGADERVEHGGTDLVGLHEYVPGDDLRRLHWATSARTGTLMVRDDADPAEPHLLVLLDDRTSSYPDDSEDFEDAVEMAAALCAAAVHAGQPVHLLTVSGRVDVDVPAASTGLPGIEARELTLNLAEVELCEHAGIAKVSRRDLDVAVPITGSRAREAEFVLATAGAGEAVLLVVDEAPVQPVRTVDGVLVLTAARSEDLAATWDLAVRQS